MDALAAVAAAVAAVAVAVGGSYGAAGAGTGAPAAAVPGTVAVGGTADGVARPPLVRRLIPFGARRRAEMTAYARRHYASFMAPTYRLVNPRVVVEHFT